MNHNGNDQALAHHAVRGLGTMGAAKVRLHHLIALAIVAVLAFSLGLAAAPVSTRFGTLAMRSQPVAGTPSAAAITGARYDDGWAGGPGPGYLVPAYNNQQAAQWTPCVECYDQGWAGGPGPGYQPPTLPLAVR